MANQFTVDAMKLIDNYVQLAFVVAGHDILDSHEKLLRGVGVVYQILYCQRAWQARLQWLLILVVSGSQRILFLSSF